jgi:hypothetical protein
MHLVARYKQRLWVMSAIIGGPTGHECGNIGTQRDHCSYSLFMWASTEGPLKVQQA